MNIAVIFGTRPEAIKVASVIHELRKHEEVNLTIISTGQHKEMLDQILHWFEIVPDIELNLMKPNQSLASLSSLCIDALDKELENLFLDLLIVQGDTTTAFVAALVGFYRKIKIAHVEAGLRTFNIHSPWPEEGNRALISRIAEFHFAPTANNKENLLLENVAKEKITVTGNTVIDSLFFSSKKVEERNIYPENLAPFYNGEYKSVKIVLITGHRRENFGKGFIAISEAIKKLAENNPEVFFIYPVHLNPNVQETIKEYLSNQENVILISPLTYPDFISLMKRSTIILTDSGGVQEEGPSLGKPVLVMRENTERPEALESGTVKLVGTDSNYIIDSVQELLDNEEACENMGSTVNPYGDGSAAKKIVSEILKNV